MIQDYDYLVITNPDKYKINKLSDLKPHLEKVIDNLESNPLEFDVIQKEEKWSNYESFLNCLKHLLSLSKKYPNAEFYIDRHFL
jgi:hypothetical protein